MGYRLSKITTRTGDNGSTGLANGTRLSKAAPQIQVLGEVDELNSQIGLLRCESLDAQVASQLHTIQHDLFDLGGELSLPTYQAITPRHLESLEQWIEEWNAMLSPLKEFILPAGCRAAALAHVARCVCRRAERQLVLSLEVQQANTEQIGLLPAPILPLFYLNRLSDYLFVLARICNRHAGLDDVCWQPQRQAPI